MKKKNTMLGVLLLLAVVVLGVGYAAATGPWVINGTATAQAGDFDVAFTAVDNTNIASIGDDGISATMTASLKELTDKVEATFTITNRSAKGMGATIPGVTVKFKDADDNYTIAEDASEYFTVATELSGTTIASNGGTQTLKVTVTLKKAVTNTVTENFQVSLGQITASQE